VNKYGWANVEPDEGDEDADPDPDDRFTWKEGDLVLMNKPPQTDPGLLPFVRWRGGGPLLTTMFNPKPQLRSI
jgi:hypothetical protein